MRTRGFWVVALVLLGFIGLNPCFGQDVVNLLENGGFETGDMTAWNTYGSVTTEVVTDLVGAVLPERPVEGDYALHLMVPSAGANFWDAGLQHQGHVFEEGKYYTLSAWLKCNEGELQINFKPELSQDPWTGYGAQSFTMTDEWQEFSVTTPVFSSDVSPGSITFHIQYAAGDFWMDGVRFYEGDYVPPVFQKRTMASDPVPGDGATDIPRDAELTWRIGELAGSHDVYFGTAYDDVNNASVADPMGVLASEGQSETTFDPEGLLEYGQTYYWRVDEVNATADKAVFKGNVWSFTAEPYVYPVENITATASSSEEGSAPANVVNGSGLSAAGEHSINAGDMWLTSLAGEQPAWIQFEFDRVYQLHEMTVWNYNVQFELVLGYGVKDATVEYSTDGVEWTPLGDIEFARATAKSTYVANTTVDLSDVVAKYVRFTINSNWGGLMPQFGLSEVQFVYKPVVAREPIPADGQSNVALDGLLDWRDGRDAALHDVYLSTDRAAVESGVALVDSVSESRYAASGLDLGATYYWKVDEVNEAADPAVWEGDIWSFSTSESVLIEGFETYDDEDNRIYDTWLDGFINDTGSTVGYLEAPFAERSIVNSGFQSMPLEYDNSVTPYYSEATREFDSEDWTVSGADTLFVSFRGRGAVFTERADGSILMGGGGADIWGTSDQFRFAYKQLSGDGSVVVRVDSVANSNEWAKAGVMIRQNTNGTAVNAGIFVTPENGVSFQYRTTAGSDSANVAQAGLVAPYWVKLNRTGAVFTAQYSADGTTWTDLAAASPVTITMTGSVLIGLAVTSHDAGIMTNAEFSNISTTGSVSGAWQVQAIGIEQPGNDAASLYVAVEDTSGHVATVMHSDATATLATAWQQWQIPLSDFAGVNMARVRTLSIGVGDPENPSADGTGLVYIDDIAFGHPAAAETE